MNNKFDRIILVIAIIWYVLTAICSTGYYHGDEHYQIIEFAGYKGGTVLPIDLAWEFHDQMRPAIQPAITYVVFGLCEGCSITDPYAKAFILRLLTSLMALIIIYNFTNSCRGFISKKYWHIFLALSYFLWFLPFINVRFSSETWSGLALLAALALVLRNPVNRINFLFIGILLGFGFLFRFQTAIAGFGLFIWLAIIKKERFSNLLVLLFSSAIIVGLGALIDYWFYGNWVFVPWNYFNVNLLEGKSAEFGDTPWYYYVYYVFRFSFFPIGILIIIAFLLLVYRSPKNIFVWTILPFILVHSIIPHKELRFLFPIINLVPVVLMLAYQKIDKGIKQPKYRKLVTILSILVGVINLVAVVVASLKPAEIGRMRITKTIHEQFNDQEVHLISCCGSNPYDPWGGLVAKFYIPPQITFENLSTIDELNSMGVDNTQHDLLVLKSKYTNDLIVREFISSHGMKKITQSIPEYYVPFLRIYGGFSIDGILVLYGE